MANNGDIGNGVENLTREQLELILKYSHSDDMILPLEVPRKDVNNIKAVKVSDIENEKIANFQEYLSLIGYIQENTFAAMFVYIYNLAFTLHKKRAENQAKEEESGV